LAVNTGSAGAPVLFNGALGTPTSGTVTNLTGTASININGTVGATTPAQGNFTFLFQGAAGAQGVGVGFSGAAGQGFSLRDTTNSRTYFFTTETSAGLQINAGANPISLIASSVAVTGALSATGIVTAGDYFNATAADNGYRISGTTIIGGNGTNLYVKGATSVNVQVPNGTTVGTFSSTGLAVTGTGTFSGNLEITKQTPRIAFTGTGSSTDSYSIGTDFLSFGDFAIRNTTDGRNDLVISGTGAVSMPGGGGLAVTGQLAVGGATKAASIRTTFTGNTIDGISLKDSADQSNAVFAAFRKSDGAGIGSITRVTTTNAVVYNTTSDGRLKENLRDFTDSGRLIDSLKPRVFDWKNSDENGKNVVGFIAQEEHAADPMFAHIGAVSVGDEDTETITKQWQRSDSALIPILVAELKALRQRVAALEKSN
jgi:hypothetical protein